MGWAESFPQITNSCFYLKPNANTKEHLNWYYAAYDDAYLFVAGAIGNLMFKDTMMTSSNGNIFRVPAALYG